VDEFHCSTVLRPQALIAEDPTKHGEGPRALAWVAGAPNRRLATQHENWLGAEGGKRRPGAEGAEARSSGVAEGRGAAAFSLRKENGREETDGVDAFSRGRHGMLFPVDVQSFNAILQDSKISVVFSGRRDLSML
jgi:hypothetical protein